MRICVQRVSRASVTVDGQVVGEIGTGLLVLVGVAPNDSTTDVQYLAEKIWGLRIFEDPDGKMNRSVQDVDGGILVVSQFTLYGDIRKGRRPSFTASADPEFAKQQYEKLVQHLRKLGASNVQTGQFRAHMEVALVNDGPVTLLLDSTKLF